MVKTVDDAIRNFHTYLEAAIVRSNEEAGHSSPGGFRSIDVCCRDVRSLDAKIITLGRTATIATMVAVLGMTKNEQAAIEEAVLAELNCITADEATKEL